MDAVTAAPTEIGWIVGIQMRLLTRYFRPTAGDPGMAFREAVQNHVRQARAQYPEAFRDGQSRLLVFPESIGAWLIFACEEFAECFECENSVDASVAFLRGMLEKYSSDWDALLAKVAPHRHDEVRRLVESLTELVDDARYVKGELGERQASIRKLGDELRRLRQVNSSDLDADLPTGIDEEAYGLEREIGQLSGEAAAMTRQLTSLGMEIFRHLYPIYADEMVEIFDQAMREVAEETRSWIVAGSLYAPRIEPSPEGRPVVSSKPYGTEDHYERRLRELLLRKPKGAPFYNLAPVYGPDGTLRTCFPKCFPTRHEIEEVGAAGVDPEEWQAIQIDGLGKLGVVICADSWYPTLYEHARQQGVQILAVPSLGGNRDKWDQPWNGYSGSGHLPIYDESVIRNVTTQHGITEGGAWTCFALTRQMPTDARLAAMKQARRGEKPVDAPPEIGINVFAVGRVFESRLGGRSVAVWFSDGKDGVHVESTFAPYVDEPAHVAICLKGGQVQDEDDKLRPNFRVNTRWAWE